MGPLHVRQYGLPVVIPGAKPRAILTMLGLYAGSVLPADSLVELLWGDEPPRTAEKALQTHISSLRRTLGEGVVLTEGAGWTLAGVEADATRYTLIANDGRDAASAGDTSRAVARFAAALALWRGIPDLPDSQRGASERTRWIEDHAALVEDRADALLATGRAAELIGELEAAVGVAPLRERRWGQLMLALYRSGRQGEALAAYRRARSLLADELGVDPGPDLRRLEAAIVAQDSSLDIIVAQHLPSITRAVTFLLTDIEGSTAAWESDADAMAVALARHDELVEQAVTSRGGRLIKTRGEGDATFSVFERPSAAAAAALELQDAIVHEPWPLREAMRIRVALHTGEAELRDGDYFGRAVNRAARLRSLAVGGQILCSGATAELVVDTLPDDVVLADLGMRQLRNLARPEHVFELRLETPADGPAERTTDVPIERPGLPAVLAGAGPFVGRLHELEALLSAWQITLAAGLHAVLIAGEPGVGKTRLAGEWSRQAHAQGAVVIYGRCDEGLGAPYQPFAEALRSLAPCLGASRLRGIRGVEALLPLIPGLTEFLPDIATPARADPGTERYALFDAVVALLEVASAGAPVILVLDDLHWAAKPTLLLLRHLLRFGEHARVQILGTYRSTDLDRSHPLAAMLADLHRDGTADRIQLGGLDEDDVTAYVAEAGYGDEELARALASVTGGNPFFLIEALRHVDEIGGVWDPSTLPQGVREAVSRRLSRLPGETNKALAAAAVVGCRFSLELVEQVVGQELMDAFDEASTAGIVVEETGGRYRFNHAIVRQSLLAELASVRRLRLHQRIATTLENEPGANDELLAELAYHYFECAWAGNAAKAVEYCRRAADQAMARLGYEGAADLYDHALHALDEIDDALPDREDQTAELLIARCEALLAAGDVAAAEGVVSQLQEGTRGSERLAAWATCFDGQISMLTHPERLDELECAVGAAADKLAELADAAGEAMAHTVRAACLARLGRVGDCEIALDDALGAARRAREDRRVNAVLAGAPLAALWGPNPVPRAGGRCLDVVRLLRITTDSPAVEATSTRCQAVLEAFRGRTAAARRMIDSARRTVTEIGLRHALLEVEQFAGIVELVADEHTAAEPYLRKAYNGFRRMGLDADTAETAALLGRSCLALDRVAEADELCSESARLAGHALKPSIAWRTLRAQLLSRDHDYDEARRVAEEAVGLAERTDGLVDHGDACLALATVLNAAGDAGGARAAAGRAVDLYERKGAAVLADKARRLVGVPGAPVAHVKPELASAELETACVRAIHRLEAALDREAWDEVEQLLAPVVAVESRRKIVGFTRIDLQAREWPTEMRRYHEVGMVRYGHAFVAVRGERLALVRLEVGSDDESPGAPQVETLRLFGLDEEGRIALQVAFDIEDVDAAIAELDGIHARFEAEQLKVHRLQNAASRVVERFWTCFLDRDWESMAEILAGDASVEDRRPVVNYGLIRGSYSVVESLRVAADTGVVHVSLTVVATRGERLVLVRICFSSHDERFEAFQSEFLVGVEIDDDQRSSTNVVYDVNDFAAAIEELDARYLAGEAAAHAHTWSVIGRSYAGFSQGELPAMTPDCVTVDHRRATASAPGELPADIRAGWDIGRDVRAYVEVVHRLSDLGAVCSFAAHGVSREGFDAEWRILALSTVHNDMVNRCEFFDESDLVAAMARFDQLSRPAPRLANTASQVNDRFDACFGARDWDAMADMLTDDVCMDDRRPVVGSGIRRGRDTVVADARANANLGVAKVASTVIATRGDRLMLGCARFSGRDQRPEAFHTEALGIVEVDADERIVAVDTFDPDDIHAAFAELEARYLAGEAAPHAHTWSVVTGAYAAVNRHEFPATAPDWVNIDHRGETVFGAGNLNAYFRAGPDLDQDISIYLEAVHQLTERGAVITYAAREISQDGFDAEWRGVAMLMLDGDMVERCEVFDEAEIATAVATFEQLNRPTPQLENSASRAYERFNACLAARDWDAMAEMIADDNVHEDRRRVIGGAIRRGRNAEVANLRAAVEVGVKHTESVVIATRGERLALTRIRVSGGDQRPEAFGIDVLCIIEIHADIRISAGILFDLDDIDAAFEELDARYLVGEAAAHAQTWGIVAGLYAAFNRHELPAADWVTVDHRPLAALDASDLQAALRNVWELTPDLSIHLEAVHRLTSFGAAVTLTAQGTSREGLEVEWRMIEIVTVEGDRLIGLEIFDDADLENALAYLEALRPRSRRLENAASQLTERYWKCFSDRDWDAMADLLAEGISTDDRRQVVGAGVRHGRAAEIAEVQTTANLGTKHVTPVVIAVRGQRLALMRIVFSGRDERPDAFHSEILGIVEINTGNLMTARVVFDADDREAAFAELDARYIAGEASAHARTWSVFTNIIAAFNRHELPAIISTFASIDHRHGAAHEPGDLFAYTQASWSLTTDRTHRIEAVHRLGARGAVFTAAAYGTTQDGLDAEWRMVAVGTVEGDLLSRSEIFDETDLDAALARFAAVDSARCVENAATQTWAGVVDAANQHHEEGFLAHAAADARYEDRRKVLHDEGASRPEVIRALFEMTTGWRLESEPVAIRGSRLGLTRDTYRDMTDVTQPITMEHLTLLEVGDDNLGRYLVLFDTDDRDAAFAELDARYLAGEAAPYARTWSVIVETFSALNRHETLPTKPDWVNIDHRRGVSFAPGELPGLLASWNLSPDVSSSLEVVHRLDDLGAVLSAASFETSPEGVNAEWRAICVLTVDGDLVDRMEVFDEADLGAALARFDELSLG